MAMVEVTVVSGVSSSPRSDCWRMTYNARTKRVMFLEHGTGETTTKNALYCDTEKQGCVDFATAHTLTIANSVLNGEE